jgi:hypothetical protein
MQAARMGLALFVVIAEAKLGSSFVSEFMTENNESKKARGTKLAVCFVESKKIWAITKYFFEEKHVTKISTGWQGTFLKTKGANPSKILLLTYPDVSVRISAILPVNIDYYSSDG